MAQDLVAAATAALAAQEHLTVKRPFWQWFSRKFEVMAPDGRLLAYIKHPIFKLRDEFTIYADREQQSPILFVKVRKLITLNHCYDVFDPATQKRLGSLRKRGMKSIVRDTFDVLDENEAEVGLLEEQGSALLRRVFPFLTSKHRLEIGGTEVARMRQVFRFFVKEFHLDLSPGKGRIDPRFAVACCLLALMAEAQREQR
jgi:uncharacterized protein YxjI